MSTKPEVIDLTTSSSSSSSSSDDSHQLFRYPHQDIPRPLKSPFLPSSEDDSVVNPSNSSRDSDDSTERLEPIFNRLVKEEDETKSHSSQSRPRLRRSNPPLSRSREVVLGLSAPGSNATSHGCKRKVKNPEVEGKGKGKRE